jgi:integral membrane protein (TIGR01906 family)
VDRRVAVALVVLVAALVPPVLAINSIRLLAKDWYVRFEYGRLPPDRYGLTRAQRTELGLVGLHSILPRHDQGIGLLRRAQLPSGGRAFRQKELRHMADVRRLIGVFYPAQLAALAAFALLAAALVLRRREVSVLLRGLRYGAAATLAIAAAVGSAVAIDADAFLTGFHAIFFEGDSWRFADGDTLRRLYPDRFWSETAIVLGLATAAQAGGILLFAAVERRLRRRQGRRTSAGAESSAHAARR